MSRPAECLNVVDALEDAWAPIGVNFYQQNVVPSLPPYQASDANNPMNSAQPPIEITVRIQVSLSQILHPKVRSLPDIPSRGSEEGRCVCVCVCMCVCVCVQPPSHPRTHTCEETRRLGGSEGADMFSL